MAQVVRCDIRETADVRIEIRRRKRSRLDKQEEAECTQNN